MRLHQFNALPNPRRVRVFLAEKRIHNVELVDVDVPGGEARRAPFRSMNPLGEVPVLELDDGSIISETTAISRYFEELRPKPALFGSTPREKAVVEMWQRRLESGLMGAVSDYFNHATPGLGTLGTQRNKDWGEQSLQRVVATMHMLDAQLEAKPFVAGGSFSIADITTLCAIDFAKYCGIRIPAEDSNLRDWYNRVSSRESASA